MDRSVTVIGGGVAGLSAAVFLAKAGLRVTLFEASPRLGGRTYSYFDKNIGDFIDNGQHIMASWYKNTFEYLRIIGTYNKLVFQKQLEVNFTNQKAEQFKLKASKLPPPLHLLKGLATFKALRTNDRLAALRLINSIKLGKIPKSQLLEANVDTLFSNIGQTKILVESFWKPFIMAVFNSHPEDTSAHMFAEIIKTGFLEKGGSNLVFPGALLSELLIEPALSFLEKNNGKVVLSKRITRYNIEENHVTSIICEDNQESKSDYYVCSVPFFEIRRLLNGSSNLIGNEGLSASPIVNIHLKFSEDIAPVVKYRFYGILESTIQWVFRVKNDQLCIVISSAKDISEMEKEAIILLSKNELYKCFPDLNKFEIKGARVIKEMRATFVPNKESLSRRPDSKTAIDNLFLAGDWTNTGLPSTIESAVRSSKNCADLILNSKQNWENALN